MATDGFGELVRQAQAGDRPAMERLLRLAGSYLKQVALGQADAELARECVSDRGRTPSRIKRSENPRLNRSPRS